MFIVLSLVCCMILLSVNLNSLSLNKQKFDKVNSENKILDVFQNNEEKLFFVKLASMKKFSIDSSLNTEKILVSGSLNNKIENNFGDYITLNLNQTEYLLLKKENPSLKIFPVGIKHITLQDSIGLINVTSVWNSQINTINLTGIGQTICIIDTGVNYSHSDLGGCFGSNNPFSSCKVLGGIDLCPTNINCNSGGSDDDPLDVHGHGTHVAGIAASNGTLKGVAPGAKIIMIKVANSSGSMQDNDIIEGINWCVSNASIFNISVISMSLGGTTYLDYCDLESGEEVFVAPINSAIAKNISVVIATGNDGYYNAISSPACIHNATRVTSSPKADNAISSFANTWNDSSKMILVAPGESINSTYLSSTGYGVLSGTSMATPHVAGAIAIINQYLKLKGQTKTPQQIESLLNSTGKQIYDAGNSNLYFSRIDVYSAIASLDEIPSIDFVSPTIASGLVINRNNFIVNVSSNSVNIKNITIRLYNSTYLLNSTTGVLSSLLVNFTNLVSGIYYFNATAYTIFNNVNFSETRNVTIDTIYPTYFNISTNGELKRYTNFTANISFSDNHGLNVGWFESNYTGNLTNYSLSLLGLNQNVSLSFNITTNLKSFSYRWNFNDSAGNINSTTWQTILVVNSPPISLGIANQSWVMNSNLTLNLSEYFTDIDGDELNYTNTSVANLSIFINQITKIVILTPDAGWNGTSYIRFIANDSGNITYSNNITLEIFKPVIVVNLSLFSNLTTNFSALTNFINIPVIFDNLNYGRINFSSVSLNNNSINIDDNVNISFNRIEINSSALGFFNTSAVLTLLNLTWNLPMIQRDGVNCTTCSLLNYTNGTLIFNVTGFSTYRTIENPFCGDGSCNNGESCSSCSGDCGTCPPSSGGGSPGGGGGITPVKNQTNLTLASSILGNNIDLNVNQTKNNTLQQENTTQVSEGFFTPEKIIVITKIISAILVVLIIVFACYSLLKRKNKPLGKKKKL